MTPDEIYDSLPQSVSRDLMNSGFSRLRKRGVAFKVGRKWGLVGRDDATVEAVAAAPVDHEQSTPMITNPTGHQLQPSLSRVVVPA